jgi:hypothetical protein
MNNKNLITPQRHRGHRVTTLPVIALRTMAMHRHHYTMLLFGFSLCLGVSVVRGLS